jgi:hypothetical protein
VAALGKDEFILGENTRIEMREQKCDDAANYYVED